MPTDAGFNVVRGALNRELRRHTNAGYGCRYITVALAELDRLEAQQAEDDALHVQVVAERAALEAERDALGDSLIRRDETLQRWRASYPESVFLPLNGPQVDAAVKAIQATGITSDALHAQWARHILRCIIEDIAKGDKAANAEPVEHRLKCGCRAWMCTKPEHDSFYPYPDKPALSSPSRDSAEREESHG